MLQPGDTIGRFRVERLVGAGGSGVVYQVRHRQLESLHALKVFASATSHVEQELLREGRIQAALQHPNVLGITDVVEDEGRVGLVMELIDGCTLRDRLAAGPIPPVEALDLFRQVLSGVCAAHDQGFLHRDLKPANILLTTIAEQSVAKVADFGIAHAPTGETGPFSGQLVGTPGYMAPEQILAGAAVDLRTDIYSLGAVLYEMLSGTRAIATADVPSMLRATLDGGIVPLLDRVSDCPIFVAAAVDTALSVVAGDRHSDCRAFAAALGVTLDVIDTREAAAPVPSFNRQAKADAGPLEDWESAAAEAAALAATQPGDAEAEDDIRKVVERLAEEAARAREAAASVEQSGGKKTEGAASWMGSGRYSDNSAHAEDSLPVHSLLPSSIIEAWGQGKGGGHVAQESTPRSERVVRGLAMLGRVLLKMVKVLSGPAVALSLFVSVVVYRAADHIDEVQLEAMTDWAQLGRSIESLTRAAQATAPVVQSDPLDEAMSRLEAAETREARAAAAASLAAELDAVMSGPESQRPSEATQARVAIVLDRFEKDHLAFESDMELLRGYLDTPAGRLAVLLGNIDGFGIQD